MTAPNPPSDHNNWQQLYSSSESRWKDVERTVAFLIPIIALMFPAVIYVVVGYEYVHMEEWVPQEINRFSYTFYVLRIVVVILAPVMAITVGLIFIFKQTEKFLRTLYQLQGNEKLPSIIQYRFIGIPQLPLLLDRIIRYPFIVIREPVLDKNHWARLLGGPATLVIFDGVALYLERQNAFSRVVGPGLPMPFLDRHEKIKEVIDLRPQTKTGDIITWTKDGIQITLTFRMECQINASHDALTRSSKFRFPFDPLAVKTAVEHMTVAENPDRELYESSWLEGAWGIMTNSINTYVAHYSLDELFPISQLENNTDFRPLENNFSNYGAQTLSRKFMEELEKTNRSLVQSGIKVLDIEITNVEFPKEVFELQRKYLDSVERKGMMLRESQLEADRIRVRGEVYAEAQLMMLKTIIENLQKVDPADLTEQLLFSVLSITDQGLDDQVIKASTVEESLALLLTIRKMLNEGF